MYVEPKEDEGPNEWSYRQTCVYHQHSIISKSSRIILLHPNGKTVAQNRIEELVHQSPEEKVSDHPMNIHLVVLSAYLANWPEYNEGIANEISDLVST